MKVCSFLPAATNMIYQMGLEEFGELSSAILIKLKVVRSVLEGNNYTSLEIDKIVSRSKQEGKSLYYIDEELLLQIAPDIIHTKDVCDVCQISTSYVEKAIYKLKNSLLLFRLFPVI